MHELHGDSVALDHACQTVLLHLFHAPMYLMCWARSVLFDAPRALLMCASPTIKDVISLLEQTSLSLLLQPQGADGESCIWVFDVRDCELVSFGQRLGSIKISYTRSPLSWKCMRNGEELVDPSLIFSHIFAYLVTGIHTKTHIFSNLLIKRLHEMKNPASLSLLSASTYHSLPLHNAALTSSLSPLRFDRRIPLSFIFGYDVGVDRFSLLLEEENLSALAGHQVAAATRLKAVGSKFSSFISQSRIVLISVLKENGINLSSFESEAPFNHTIVHSLDHYCMTVVLRNTAFSMNPWRSPSMLDIIRAQIFVGMFAAPNLNSLWCSNLIKDVGRGIGWTGTRARDEEKSFWSQLHMELSEIDKELADQVTASIMY